MRADAVKIAPRIAGYVAEVAVSDNQQVKKGQLLFTIEANDFQLDVQHAQVSLDQAREDAQPLDAAVRAAEAMVEQSHAAVKSARGKITAAEAGVRSAEAVASQRPLGLNAISVTAAVCPRKITAALSCRINDQMRAV